MKLQVGQKLGKFDVEKRRAIELEDFDTAKKKKVYFDIFHLKIFVTKNLLY